MAVRRIKKKDTDQIETNPEGREHKERSKYDFKEHERQQAKAEATTSNWSCRSVHEQGNGGIFVIVHLLKGESILSTDVDPCKQECVCQYC